MDINTLLNFLTTLAIIAGGIFAAVQILQFKKQRARDAALQMLNSTQTIEFMEAIHIIYNLPEGLSKKEIEDQLEDKMTYILMMFVKFESLGLLVYRREIKLQLVKDFIGGPVLLFWMTLKNYFIETRQTGNKENYGEWAQWLAEQLQKKEFENPKKPAHITYKNWKE
jgi:hypothetical protein